MVLSSQDVVIELECASLTSFDAEVARAMLIGWLVNRLRMLDCGKRPATISSDRR